MLTNGTAADGLRRAIDGRVHLPGQAGYDAARLPWQRAVDPYPSVIVDAAGPHDVLAAVRAAREHDLPLAVQATGHGAVAPSDDGVLLRTAAMDSVEVDPARRIARAGGGALWTDVIAAAAPHGLAPLSGTSAAVGVTGYTLGGGAGWLSRSHGFAADGVLRADVVTAGGELVTATPHEHPDLHWALRGGGGNFGVVCSLEFRLHPVGGVYGGMAMFDVERAADTLAVYREWALEEPDASSTAVVVAELPPAPLVPEALRGRRVLMLRAFYLGEADEAERLFAPLLDAAGPPLMSGLRATSFADAAAMMGGAPPPMAAATAFELLHEVPDEVIAAAVAAEAPVAAVELRHWGGAMARPSEGAGPIGHRDVPFSAFVVAQVPDREQLPEARAAVERVAAAIRPHATGGSFLNFLGDPGRTATAYTPDDHRRLAEVKRAYDPGNLFSAHHNIAPA